jgi:chromosome segregation protein
MRLDRLEISGFKSFSDRAELAFDEGVTAIVGPNGCGKSNVADAITWVLGEQSAKSLRGDRMEDVIFNGSDARKPGGTAEVRLRLSGLAVPPQPATDTPAPLSGDLVPFQALTGEPAVDAGNGHAANGHSPNGHGTNGHAPLAQGFDGGTMAAVGTHPDLDEFASRFTRDVEVTRRLYRSGDSEYLIDGQVCRLRDVHELLMDTGLGAKAYAIIEQGKIGMILSSRPADRRQLIEEAAGITKYKSRRRAAELKLEAAQQNLARIDDIVFEVEKQRGTLKRQAAKARRYKKLREELRRWEKVLFARRYRELSKAIEAARDRLAAARERETAAAARLAGFENDLSRLRLELTAVEERASAIREDAHARELQVSARQQQLDFNCQQDETIAARSVLVAEEVRELESRREPARLAIEARRAAALEAEQSRDAAAGQLAEATEEHAHARAGTEALEAEVDGVRTEVYNGASAMAAIRHAVHHAAAQVERVAELLGKLDVERKDLTRETEVTAGERAAVLAELSEAQTALAQVRAGRSEREREIADVRQALDASQRDVRTREQEAAALDARLASLEELASSRAEFGDAARLVLQQANGRVGQMGAVADYLDVDPAYERAVEASLGDLLQYVVVERHEHASEGLSLVRGADAGRCGFVVLDSDGGPSYEPAALRADGVVPVTDVVRVSGPHAGTVRRVLLGAYVADTFDRAVAFARQHDVPVATPDGDLVRGRHLVAGGARAESRGILATKREIRDLRARVDVERVLLSGAVAEAARLDAALVAATSALSALIADQHEHEKAIVGHEAQLGRVDEAGQRHARRNDVISLEERQAQEERVALDTRQQEAARSIAALEVEHRQAEERLAEAQRRLAGHRDAAASLSDRVAGVGALHAGLVERVTAVVAEIGRLEDSARDLETRIEARTRELEDNAARRADLTRAVEEGVKAIDEEARRLLGLREQLVSVDEEATGIRGKVDAQEAEIRTARAALDETRTEAGAFDLARAQSESDLSHLAQACMDAVQLPLDTVLAEVVALEEAGEAIPDAAALAADEPETFEADSLDADTEEAGLEERGAVAVQPEVVPVPGSITAEEAIVRLREKIERLGPVNMMAIEQFDELETRHTFLTTQRADLTESIAQTSEAIARIDETTAVRFNEAFTAIQTNFQQTFSTLFGGGRASLALTDENDPLNSGIDIVASPPGKRLQSVQLLSGGEKALTAISLMFAIFKYKPSPFCLLDEIDAPLDDANVGRFVEMLRGMMDRTQFILITHNRRTMEIADRLYGVTMEEPGVSKLISVHLH